MPKLEKTFAGAVALFLVPLAVMSGEIVDFHRISHWAGEGDSAAALAVSFGGDSPTFVWGWRFDAGGSGATAERMLREVAVESGDLLLLLQFTGDFGCTVGGIGVSPGNDVLGSLCYDYDSYYDDRISFGYFEPNTAMGQTSAPEEAMPGLLGKAFADARVSHVIDHPFNALEYGYPAYDYDWWKLDDTYTGKGFWKAGWYDCYWSFWHSASADFDRLAFSSAGISGTDIVDGGTVAFQLRQLGEGDMFPSGSAEWGALDYIHDFDASGILPEEMPCGEESRAVWHTLSGLPAGSGSVPSEPGIYVRVKGGKAEKIFVKP